MSTRSLTIVKNPLGEEVAVFYRHWDGYPRGHGAELVEFLSSYHVIPEVDELISELEEYFSGDFHILPPETRNMWENYLYVITPTGLRTINLEVEVNGGGTIFDGDVKEFDPSKLEE
jgi:hypothetical protein